MAHYAKVVDNIVTQVIVAEEEFFDTFVDSNPGKWIQTSYNTHAGEHIKGGTPLRYNYAGIGYTYDADADAFIPPRNFPSWTLNTDKYIWEPPIPYPTDDNIYYWDEDAYQANNKKGWVLMSGDD